MTGQLSTLLKNRISAAWIGLVVATLISWRIGTDHGLHASLATAVVLVVAFVKVRVVGVYFMELRHAPAWLRSAFEGYCLLVCTALIVMYLAA